MTFVALSRLGRKRAAIRSRLGVSATLPGMSTTAEIRIDLDTLMAEIARYLAAVETFRAEEREPSWLPEPVVDPR